MWLTYKYKLKLNSSDKKWLLDKSILVNQVWNYCNSYQRDVENRYKSGSPIRFWPSYYDFCYMTAGSSKLLGLHSHTISQICEQYEKSRNQSKRSTKFRISNGSKRSLGWIPFGGLPGDRQINGNEIKYMKRKFRWFGSKTRKLNPEMVKPGCFTQDASGDWYVCFNLMVEERETGNGIIGIDLGLKSLATLSDGLAIEAPQFYRKSEKKLAIAQRANNKKRVKKIYKKVVNQRKDMLHKLSSKIAKDNMCIVVGDVSSSKLVKTNMAKSVYDASWASLRFMLEYKARRHQAIFLNVDESYTSQVCSCCGIISVNSPKGMNGLGIREWECSECGTHHDRDVNSAINILNLAWGSPRLAEESAYNKAIGSIAYTGLTGR